MKHLLYLLISLFLLTACRSNRSMERTSNSRYDSLVARLSEKATLQNSNELRQQTIIDSLRKTILPQERSQNILPMSVKRSDLETSFARSSAWVDSLGLLHHVLMNKDSARVLQRTVTQNHERSDNKATTSVSSATTNVTGKTDFKEKKTEVVQKKRFAGAFFYYSGWVFWVGITVFVIYYLQTSTTLKPITRIINLLRIIIKL